VSWSCSQHSSCSAVSMICAPDGSFTRWLL